MKKVLITLIATLVTTSAQASDLMLTVACYPYTSRATLYLQVWANPAGLTYSYDGVHGSDTCSVEAQGSFSLQHSYTQLIGSTDSGAVELIVQILKGDVITPIFECNAEAKLAKNSDGKWILQSGNASHLNVTNDFVEFIGQPCYVQ